MTVDSPTFLKTAVSRSLAPRLSQSRSTMAEMKARQSAKLREIKWVLVDAGIVTLDAQAETLGLGRSTTWSILRANHKSSGLLAATVNRILMAPQLPPFVRARILEYVEDNVAGRYGHSKMQRRKFIARLSTDPVEPVPLKETVPLQPERRILRIA
jgi:hypothetical protein